MSVARALAVAGVVALSSACPDGSVIPDEDAGTEPNDCAAFCELEAECGLRTGEACVASSCEGEARKPSTSDACIAEAVDCAEVVLCTCAEACAKVAECTGSDDPACVETCETLAAASPDVKYVENRCLIESACADIAICSN